MRVDVPSPLVGEGGDAGRHKLTGVRGISAHFSVSIETPQPALRATFSHKGRRKAFVAPQRLFYPERFAGFFLDAFSATAARISAFNAFSLIFSPSRISIARRTLPSRLELNRPAGSSSAAPLAKVIFTTAL